MDDDEWSRRMYSTSVRNAKGSYMYMSFCQSKHVSLVSKSYSLPT